ncbi:MAG: hypothetical protein LW817_04435, partial [Candidatus Caenarcaniphilales bacterium]|nr:hypothetical protein [Candidatus Caenarcaniphilales bacterium]
MFLSVSLFLNLILFVAGIYLFLALRAQKKQLIKSFRNYLQGITALNISHLHDSANFFNLINKHLESRPPETIYNFAKGASFHFRALFEELKNNFDSYWQQSETDLPQFKNLYQKEQINLKDIFDMELFQISRFERLEFIDKSNSEYAFINGNFSLISKMFLNLLENALKYTDDKIKLELKSVADKWQVRISSF